MKTILKPKNLIKIVIAIIAVWLITETLPDTHSSYVDPDYYYSENYSVQTEELLGVEGVAEILGASEYLYEDELEQEINLYAEEVDTHAEEFDATVEELADYAEEINAHAEEADSYVEEADVYVEEADIYAEEADAYVDEENESDPEVTEVAEDARPIRDFFEDEALANAVASAFRISGIPGATLDTYVTQANIASITRLNIIAAVDGHVQNLTGIDQLVNLEHLNANIAPNSEIQISDISPLATMTNLEEVLMSYQNISDLTPLSGLYNLTSLILNYNSISDLTPLSRLTGLETLHVTSNNITDFRPLAPLVNLTTLGVNFQEINLGQVVIDEPVPLAIYYPDGTRVNVTTSGTIGVGTIAWHELGTGFGNWNSSFQLGGLEVTLFTGSIRSEVVEAIVDEPIDDEPIDDEPIDDEPIVGEGWTDEQYEEFEALVAQIEAMFLTTEEAASIIQLLATLQALPYAPDHPFVYALAHTASEHGGEVAGADADGFVELLADVIATVEMGTRGVGFDTIMDILDLIVSDVETLTTILRNSIELAPYATENLSIYSNVRAHMTFISELLEAADGMSYYSLDDVVTLSVRDCDFEITIRELYELMNEIFVGLRNIIENTNDNIYADFINEDASIEETIVALATNNDEFNAYLARIEAIIGSIEDCGDAGSGGNNGSGDNNNGGGDNSFCGDTSDDADCIEEATPPRSGGAITPDSVGVNNATPVLPQTGVATVASALTGIAIAGVGVVTAVTKYKKK